MCSTCISDQVITLYFVVKIPAIVIDSLKGQDVRVPPVFFRDTVNPQLSANGFSTLWPIFKTRQDLPSHPEYFSLCVDFSRH